MLWHRGNPAGWTWHKSLGTWFDSSIARKIEDLQELLLRTPLSNVYNQIPRTWHTQVPVLTLTTDKQNSCERNDGCLVTDIRRTNFDNHDASNNSKLTTQDAIYETTRDGSLETLMNLICYNTPKTHIKWCYKLVTKLSSCPLRQIIYYLNLCQQKHNQNSKIYKKSTPCSGLALKEDNPSNRLPDNILKPTSLKDRQLLASSNSALLYKDASGTTLPS